MFKADVLCIGSATVDNFLVLEQPFSSIASGDKALIRSLERHSGGGATNAAAALRKLGLRANVLTKLGQDHDAAFINRELAYFHIRNICRSHSRQQTDASFLLSSGREKDRIILVHKGASQDLVIHDFRWSQLNTHWLYLAALVGKAFATSRAIATYALQKKIPLLFNPSLYLAKKGKQRLKSILQASAILVLNTEEAQALLGTTSSSPEFLLRGLQRLGPQMVVITNGPKRLFALYDGQLYSLQPPAVQVVHTAGAGDAFTAGLLGGIIKKYSFEDALRLGQVNACSVIQHVGTKNKLLTEREAQQLMRKYTIKVSRTVVKKIKNLD